MNTKKATLCLAILLTSFLALCQESEIYRHSQKRFQDALALYNNKQYQAAQTIFEEVKVQTGDEETRANSAYYAATSAIRLNQLGADRLMEDFVEEYPTSTKRNSAFMDVADYYFENGKYPYALKWYKKVDQSTVSAADKDRYNFNLGYSLFASKKSQEAERYLNRVSSSATYGSQAQYYLGYIAYQQDDYEGANERFGQITDEGKLNDKLSYYQADMNFKLGNFQQAIELAQSQLPKSDRREASELNKIIGESYFNLNQFAEAIPYLEAYKGKRGKWSNTDYYLLGYCYYKQEDYANAIQQFNKIIGGTNSVAQNAYYHLAECYLKLNKKQEALNAFRNASEMEFDEGITRDAFLNYARLSYDIGNAYEPVPEVLRAYLERYKEDEYQEEIQELLVDSYITAKNFSGALELLEENRGYASKTTYQKVAFYMALELFVDGDYAEARDIFSKSLKEAEDQYFKARALYWKSESEYLLRHYEAALSGYRNFSEVALAGNTSEYEDLGYSMGYAHFKLKEYSDAAYNFQRYLEVGTNQEKRNDAAMRLGDSYFASGNYQSAIDAYQKVINAGETKLDYAAYQIAMSNGFLGNNQGKINALEEFGARYPSSRLNDDVLLELGNSYVKNNNGEKGIQTYEGLVQKYPESKLVPQSLLRQGLVHYNSSRNEEALNNLKAVVSKYPKSQEAVQAVATAKLIYVDLGRVDEYASWVRSLDFVEVSDAELDQASFDAAEKKYVQGNETAAIRAYQNYLKEFPNGSHVLEVNFKLAQMLYNGEDRRTSLPYFQYLASAGNNEYSEQALTRISEIYIGEDNYKEAIPYLKELEAQAEIQQNITFAQSNLMKAYYKHNNDVETMAYAQKVLATANIDSRIKSDALVMVARSAIRTGDLPKAELAYLEVLEIGQGRIAAEALYYDAYFKNRNGQYEASNSSVQKLVKDYATYKEWGAKGLIVMARNFHALDDAFQATYILENVIENFKDYPEVLEEAQTELSMIRSREAQRNSDVQPEGN